MARSALNGLVLPTPANKFKPQVKSFVLRQRGANTGTLLSLPGGGWLPLLMLSVRRHEYATAKMSQERLLDFFSCRLCVGRDPINVCAHLHYYLAFFTVLQYLNLVSTISGSLAVNREFWRPRFLTR
jgi:hypothetical protein